MKRIFLLLSLLSLTCIVYAQLDENEQKISVLLGHRYTGGFDPHGYENFNYTGLFKMGDKYYLKPTKIKVDTYIDADCSGDSVFTTQALESGECMYLFWNLGQYTKNAIETHFIAPERRFIMPGKSYVFTFNGVQYSFAGEGLTDLNKKTIENYKLTLINENKRVNQVLVEEDMLENSKVEILFIGDLDGDGKPDFIINAPPYEDTRNIMLFLSTHAKDGKTMVECVSQQFDWLDC